MFGAITKTKIILGEIVNNTKVRVSKNIDDNQDIEKDLDKCIHLGSTMILAITKEIRKI